MLERHRPLPDGRVQLVAGRLVDGEVQVVANRVGRLGEIQELAVEVTGVRAVLDAVPPPSSLVFPPVRRGVLVHPVLFLEAHAVPPRHRL